MSLGYSKTSTNGFITLVADEVYHVGRQREGSFKSQEGNGRA